MMELVEDYGNGTRLLKFVLSEGRDLTDSELKQLRQSDITYGH